MKDKMKQIVVGFCLAFFAVMALGSGTSTGETKDVVSSEKTEGETSDGEADGSDDADSGQSKEVTIDEQVLVDQDGIKITAMEYTTDSIWGDGIKLLIENDSDTDYTVGCEALIVNDYMITDLFVSEIAAGKKANETMSLSSSELKAAGIESVGKVEMYFHAYDSNWDDLFKNVYSEVKTSEFDNMDTTVDDAGTELFNEDGIRIVGKTVDENSFWGTAILLYCENNSGKNIGISVEDMSVNGFMLDPIFSTTIYDGKKVVDDITLLSSDLEKNGITSIDEVELKFHIYDEDSYGTIKDTDPITFSAGKTE